MYISTLPSPEVENENLLPRRGSNPGPAESEADMLPSEPARRAEEINVQFMPHTVVDEPVISKPKLFIRFISSQRSSFHPILGTVFTMLSTPSEECFKLPPVPLNPITFPNE